MKLLERDDALAALAAAHASAGRGEGRAVIVTGEPGIGKTALVGAFVDTLGVETRVLEGTCDDLSVPRPLGPFADLVGSVSPPLEEAITGAAPPHELHRLLHGELDVRSRTTILVVEDVHWADDATLDALRFLARRIASLPAVLVLTARSGEAPPGHPLHTVLGDVPGGSALFVELAPLSEEAVVTLAGDAAGEVFAVTRGNPFLVMELLADRDGAAVPPSIAHAAAGRLARLGPDARRLVELVAVVPRRVATPVLDHALPDWPLVAAEPERRHLLEVRPRFVSFRHELTRAAVVAGLPAATRRRLHGDVLAALLAVGADAADLVHHAEAAGDDETVAANVLAAARRAATLQSSREAFAHYRRALDFLDRHPAPEAATILEELAGAAHRVGRFDDAIAAVERALGIWRTLDERNALGRCTRLLSRLYWYTGDGRRSRDAAAKAAAILEPLGDSPALTAAYAILARLAMLASDPDGARAWAGRALALAESLGDEPARINALVTLATVDADLEPGEPSLLDAHAAATAAGLHEEAIVALGNLADALMRWGLPRAAAPQVERAIAEAEERELHPLASYGRTMRAWLRLRAGDWDSAERSAHAETRAGESVSELLAQTVMAELAVRRGDDDAEERLAQLDERAARAGEPQRRLAVLDLLAERSATTGAPAPVDRVRSLLDGSRHPQLALRAAAAAAVAGLVVDADTSRETPYSRVAARDWRGAAAAFAAEGWPYEQALMLSFLDDEKALTEALELARGLGAAPLARHVARRLRALGHRVPRGPYGPARTNAAGLTARQLEVLALVAAGRTNAEIAETLVVSPRTAEHHVAAVVAKLGAASRHDVSRRAAELGLGP